MWWNYTIFVSRWIGDRVRCSVLVCCACSAGLPDNVRSRSEQWCSPARNGRFARPCDRSTYIYMSSGRSPARLVSFSRVPPRCGPDRDRAWHPREFGAVLVVSASLPLPAPPLPSPSRRYVPQCFVGGIPPSRLATWLTAHPTNRVVACRSVRHSPPRPLPHLPQGAFFFAALALADVPSASLIIAAYPTRP